MSDRETPRFGEAATEHTTQLALQEKANLRKVFRRTDMILFTVCATVGLDLIGTLAGLGLEAVVWIIVLALCFVLPYGLLMSELGSSFPEQGGPYEWVKLAFGRFQACIFAVLYWVTNPFWVGGALAFAAVAASSAQWGEIAGGSALDYIFKIVFVWFSIIVAIVSFEKGKWIPNAGAVARALIVGVFTTTAIIYAIRHGVHGLAWGDLSPSMAGFLSIVPIALFAFVGFELQANASEEMVDPQKDIPVSVARSGVLTVLAYLLPVLGVLFVLPGQAVEGLDGLVKAAGTAYSDVWGGASGFMLGATVLLLIFALATSGAVWMIGSDRTLAVSAMDGSFFPFFGKFDARFGTPVRVNLLSGVAATIFTVVATLFFTKGGAGAAAAFGVVLTIAISTTLLSYLWVFPAAYALRKKRGEVPRIYRVGRSGNGLLLCCATVTTFFCVVGSLEAVIPGLIWKLVGEDYGSFFEAWGVSRSRFEILTLGSLAVVFLIAVVGYLAGGKVRQQDVAVSLVHEET
ncbi:MAG: APC family permease [Thermoleophilia bacterium]